jgi:hypothetical protein
MRRIGGDEPTRSSTRSVSVGHILVVTGASGAGKTATVRALDARGIPGVRCFYFDSIGVPTAEVMERDYGGAEQWQASATGEWLMQLGGLPRDIRLAVLDGQTRPSFVFGAAARAAPRIVHVALLDCSSDVRGARLRGPRQQPRACRRPDGSMGRVSSGSGGLAESRRHRYDRVDRQGGGRPA